MLRHVRRLVAAAAIIAAAAGTERGHAQSTAASPDAGRGASLVGTVRDHAGRPLANVRVLAMPGARQTETAPDGRFELRQLLAGTYRVEASLIGYAPAVSQVDARAGETVEVAFHLAATPLALGGIQVTASAGARLPSAVAQGTAQLSGSALDRELGGTIAHTLRNQPGVAVRSLGPGAAMPVIRGLTGDRVLVLQDGQRTADLAGSADDHGVTIDPLTARRVEVVRGPATLLYGNNALGGVVNVITGDVGGGVPVRSQLEVVAQTESAYPGGTVNVRGTAPVGDTWAVTARAGGRWAGDMRIGDDGALGDRLLNTDSHSRNGSLAISRVAPAWSGSLAVRLFDFGYGLPTPPDADAVRLRGERVEVAGRGELAIRRRGLQAARLDFTVQDYGHDETDLGGEVAQRFALGTGAFNLLLEQGRVGPFREGAMGASLLLKDYSATGPAALTPAASSRSAGVFVFQEIGLESAGAGLQVGARADRYMIESRNSARFGPGVSRTFDAASGSVGVRAPLAPGLTGSITASRSFRAPTVEELFSAAAHAGTGAVEFGEPGLREERGRSLEALLQLSAARVDGQIAAYVNRVEDYVQLSFERDTVVGGATLPVYRYTQSDAVLRGVEGSLQVAVHRTVALGIRGDWLRARLSDGTPLSFMPPPRAGVSLRWDDGTFALGGEAHHELAQRRTGPAEETPTSAHTIVRLDAGLRLRLGGRSQSLSLRVENVGNAAHREATSRTRDFAPGAGRNIALLVRTWF